MLLHTVVNLAALYVLIRMFEYERPIICAGIYTGFRLVTDLIFQWVPLLAYDFGSNIVTLIIGILMIWLLTYLFILLLGKFQDSAFRYIIMLFGALLII